MKLMRGILTPAILCFTLLAQEPAGQSMRRILQG